MNDYFAKELESKLKPLYKKLLASVSHLHGDKDTFAVQWGDNYPTALNEGLLFVGKATNGWWSSDEDVDILFGHPNGESTIFNRHDQMIWVENQAGPNERYNTNRSAFWRVIRKVARNFYKENELNYIAWSNVCKIQFSTGQNPSGEIFNSQIDTCKEIFKNELEVLSPKFVIMFTSGYGENELLSFLNNGEMPRIVEIANWGSYSIKIYTIGELVVLCTMHPMCKPEQLHSDCLIELINKYK